MARIEEISVTLVDDIDGGEAAETVSFSLDGKNYEIDLSKKNAAALRRAFKPYVDVGRSTRRGSTARRSRGRTASAASRRQPEGYDRAEVRAWAKAHRIKVAPRGRISSEVVERWRAANGK